MKNLISYFFIIFGFFIHSNQFALSETKLNGFISDAQWLNEEKNEAIIREIYYENNCPKHGLIRYVRPGTEMSELDVFGVFANCKVSDPDSNVARFYYDKEGKTVLKELDKKDVTNVYGVRKFLGIEVENSEMNLGIKIVNILKEFPASDSKLKKEDIIIKVNNFKVKNSSNFIKLINETKQNQKIKIEYIPSDKIKDNSKYEISDIKTDYIKPKLVNQKVKLRITFVPKSNLYFENIRNFSLDKSSILYDQVILEKDTPVWMKQQKLLKRDFDILQKYYMSIYHSKSKNIPVLDFSQFNIIENKKP